MNKRMPVTMGTDRFLSPCEHRIPLGGNGGAICKLISLEVGHDHGVNTMVCAHCRMTGDVDHEHIKRHAKAVVSQMALHARAGFYTSDECEAVLHKAYQLFDEPKELAKLDAVLADCVQFGRITGNAARAIAAEFKHKSREVKK